MKTKKPEVGLLGLLDKHRVYSYFDRPPQVQLLISEPSRTKQEHKDICDINLMLERYQRTGEINSNKSQPMFGDFSEVGDYQSTLDQIMRVEEDFADLPSKIRDRFHNNPQELLDFVRDPKNKDEAVKLGFVNEKQVDPVVQKLSEMNELLKSSQTDKNQQDTTKK